MTVSSRVGGELAVTSVFGRGDAGLACLNGSWWDSRRGEWRMPFTCRNVEGLLERGHQVPDNLMADYRRLKESEGLLEEARAGRWHWCDPMPVKNVEPWPHQVRAYDMAMASMHGRGGGFGLLFDMGTGKTMTAVGIAGRLFLDGKVKRVLVLAPSSVLPEWGKALDRYADYPNWHAECTGTPAKREKALRSLAAASNDADVCTFAVVNYESAWRTEDAIMAYKPDLVICDESQRIKSHTAKQSKFAHRVGRLARYRLILSGTPLQNSPLDFFSQYMFLDPTVFGTKWAGFKARYAVEQSGWNGRTGRQFRSVVGYRNLDELTEKVHSCALRVENGVIDLPAELPPVVRYAEMGREQERVYRELRDESVAELGDSYVAVPNALAKLLRLQQVTSGFTVDDDGNVVRVGGAKADLLSEVVQEVVKENGGKLVVFFRFVQDMVEITHVLDTLGVSFVTLYGGTRPDERKAAVKAFSEGQVDVFVGQLQASGTGIDGLQNSCHTAVFYSNSFNSADYEQAKARINRSGQKKSCVFIHLVCPGTVDEKILDALNEKRNLADTIVNKGAREVF